MYRSVSLVVLGVAMLALAASTPAHALAFDEVNVHVPYAFTVYDNTFPAGDYIIQHPNAFDLDLLMLWSKDGRHAAIIPVEDASPAPKDLSKAQLIFARFGKERFLRGLQLGDSSEVTVLPARSEVATSWQKTQKATLGSKQARRLASTAR